MRLRHGIQAWEAQKMTIQIGQPAPDFQADAWIRGAHGPRKVTLSEYRGKWVVLFFYPRDFTFICPTEIASFGLATGLRG